MSREEFEELSQEAVIAPKKKMTLDKFLQQFNTLDTNNYGSWPLSVKITCWIFIILLVFVLGYFWRLKARWMTSLMQMHKSRTC